MKDNFYAFIGGSKADRIERLPALKPGEWVKVPVFEPPMVHWNPKSGFPIRSPMAVEIYEHNAPNTLTFKFVEA